MKGCRHEEKSFSVAVSDYTNTDTCANCGSNLEVYRKYNGRRLCGRCFDAIPPIKTIGTIGTELFNTSRDKLWEFTSIHVTGKPVEIRGKKQWKKFLKENNKHDDVSKRDMEVIQRNHERNLKDKEKKNVHKAVDEAYRWAKQIQGG